MDGLSEVIANAAADAHPDSAADIPVSTPTETVKDTPVVETTPAATETPTEDAQKTPEPDEIDAILGAEGIKPPVQGQRENRIPYSQTKRIIANAKTKWMAEQEAKGVPEVKALKEWREQHEPKLKALEAYENADRLATTDPDRYLEMLAKANPAYQKFLTPKEAPKPSGNGHDPRPEPDVQYQDGSRGYSPEGLGKLLDWTARSAESRALAQAKEEMTKRFGPIEQQWQAQQVQRQLAPVIQNKIKEAYSVWGQESVDKHAAEINTEMAANPKMAFENVVAKVMRGKMTTDEAAIREKLMKELQARPAAATRAPAVSGGTPQKTEPESLEDVIRQAARGKYGA